MLNTKYQSSNPSSFREKNFEVGFLCSYVPTCDPRGEASLDPMRSTKRCYVPNIKALALTVWDKKILKNFRLYLYVKSENP